MVGNCNIQYKLVRHKPITIEYDGKHVTIDERELIEKGFHKSNLKYLRSICDEIYENKEKILKLENEGEIWWFECDISPKKCKSLTDDIDIKFRYESNCEYEVFLMTGSYYYFEEEKKTQIYIASDFLKKYIRNGKYIDINGKEIYTLNLKGEI